MQIMSVGEPYTSQVPLAIVNPETCVEASPHQVGEIWVSGQSKAQGYWGKPQLSQDTFRATILGDLTGAESASAA